MANIGGFEIITPEEINAQQNARLQQMRGSSDPNVVNAANSQQVITALFGSPESRKAERTQRELTEALASVKKAPDESETDFQLRQQSEIRKRMASVDPEVALQANDNILKIQSEALERKKLGLNIDQSELELKNALSTAVEAKTPYLFKLDQATGQLEAVGKLAPDASIEEINAEKARLQEIHPENPLIVGNGSLHLQVEKLDTDSNGGLNKSAIGKIESQIDSSAQLFFDGANFLEEMKETPQALVTGARAVAGAGGFIEGARRIAGEFIGSDAEAAEDESTFNDTIARNGGVEKIRALGIESGVARGLIMSMAYTLAKALDPGGRLSDKDVDMAVSMLTGSGTPEELTKLFEQRFASAEFAAEAHRFRAERGGLNGVNGIQKFSRFDEQKKRFDQRLEEFKEIVAQGGLLRINPDLARRQAAGKPKVVTPPREATEESNSAPQITFKVRR